MSADDEYSELQPAGKMRASLRSLRKFESANEIQEGTAVRTQKLGLNVDDQSDLDR